MTSYRNIPFAAQTNGRPARVVRRVALLLLLILMVGGCGWRGGSFSGTIVSVPEVDTTEEFIVIVELDGIRQVIGSSDVQAVFRRDVLTCASGTPASAEVLTPGARFAFTNPADEVGPLPMDPPVMRADSVTVDC